jgi:GT2 family glycosyltransferase
MNSSVSKSTGKPGVCVMLIHYNRPQETIDCIQSLMNCGFPSLRIQVVDNGSTDNSLETLRRQFKDVEFVATGKNLGFTGASNFGFDLLKKNPPEYLLLLNNDTEVEPGFLDPLLRAAEQDDHAGACVSTVCYYEDKEELWYAGGEFKFWRGSGFSRGEGVRFSDLRGMENTEVSFATGCALLIRMSALKKNVLLDDRFFLYLEDADLSLRLREAGYRLVYVPASRIYHKVHHAGDKPRPLYYSTRNRLLILRLHFKGWRRLAGMGYVLLSVAAKTPGWWFRRRDLFWAGTSGVWDYFRGNLHEGRGLKLRMY